MAPGGECTLLPQAAPEPFLPYAGRGYGQACATSNLPHLYAGGPSPVTDRPNERSAGGRGARIHVASPAFAAIALAVVVFSVVAGVGASRYTSSVPALAPGVAIPSRVAVAPAATSMPWPAQGQAAIAVDGLGIVAEHNPGGKPQAIGSTAKMMTALLILEGHPLAPGATGPALTITQTDVDAYRQELKLNQSVLGVSVGQQFTERELLEGLLIPSANNFAEILGAWDAGSESAFVAKMNARAAAMGLTHTHFDDSSGYSPQTTSTASDLLVLAQAAMKVPVFAEIVAMQQVTLAGIGVVHSTNPLLQQAGVIGVKTGETDQAGGCLVFAEKGTDGRVIWGAVLGQANLAAAATAAHDLLAAVPAHLASAHVVSKGQTVADFTSAWGGSTPAVAASSIDLQAWAGTAVEVSVAFDTVNAPVAAGAKIGTLTASSGGQIKRVDLVAAGPVASPGAWWRLTR